MSSCVSDLKNKDVINICDGERLGYVIDVEVDIHNGRLMSIIVPGDNRLFCIKQNRFRISWDKIERIGNDTILVNLPIRNSKKPEKCECKKSVNSSDI